jgi:hypothetical protein
MPRTATICKIPLPEVERWFNFQYGASRKLRESRILRVDGREDIMKFQSFTRAVLLSGIALGSVTTLSSPVWAQDEAAADEADASGEIIVTARRREESLIDVPISMTAISGDTLAAQGAVDITALAGQGAEHDDADCTRFELDPDRLHPRRRPAGPALGL